MNNSNAYSHPDIHRTAAVPTAAKEPSIRPLQLGYGAAIFLILALLGILIWQHPEVLYAPHGRGTGGTSLGLLVGLISIYGVAGFTILRTGTRLVDQQQALWQATWFGMLSGCGVLVAISSDLFFGPAASVSMGIWLTVSLTTLLGWGIISLRRTRSSRFWQSGMVTVLWSGMVSVLIAIIGEGISVLVALPRLVYYELGNPDYLAWHQPDVQSYAIASVFSVSSLGLILVLIAATIVSVSGSLASRVWYQRRGD